MDDGQIQIRRLAPEDWEIFRDCRLRALKSDPGVFFASWESNFARTEADWRRMLEDPNTAIFALFDGMTPIGITGVSIQRDDPTGECGLLWASWIEVPYRGRGLSRLLYEARIAWAHAHPTCTFLEVSHRESNIASKRANQKFGFTFTGSEPDRPWPDGGVEAVFNYRLQIKSVPPA